MKRNKMILFSLLGLLLMALLVGCNNEVEEVIEPEEYIEEELEAEEIEEEPELEVEEIEEPEVEEELEEEELEGVYVLIGTWVREDDESIIYIFETDGRGTRTRPGVSYGFDWRQLGDRDDAINISSDEITGPHGQELWVIMSIEDGILVARKSTTDDDRNGVEFRYIRVD